MTKKTSKAETAREARVRRRAKAIGRTANKVGGGWYVVASPGDLLFVAHQLGLIGWSHFHDRRPSAPILGPVTLAELERGLPTKDDDAELAAFIAGGLEAVRAMRPKRRR